MFDEMNFQIQPKSMFFYIQMFKLFFFSLQIIIHNKILLKLI